MEIARDAETLGLLFKALARYRCPTAADLARRLGVPYGPELLGAIGIADDARRRWAEAEALIGVLQHRAGWPEAAGDAGPAADVAAPPEASLDVGSPAITLPAPEVRREPMTALRALRETVGLTAGQLAAKVGVPVGLVGAWERGVAVPEARQVGQLAQALGVAPEAMQAALDESQGGG